MQIWLQSANHFTVHTSTFWLKFGSLSPAVTLKIRSSPPKPNQVIMSQCYMHANLVKIHPPVHEISCKQESVTLTQTPTGSTPKTICPPPLRWGDTICSKIFEKLLRPKRGWKIKYGCGTHYCEVPCSDVLKRRTTPSFSLLQALDGSWWSIAKLCFAKQCSQNYASKYCLVAEWWSL